MQVYSLNSGHSECVLRIYVATSWLPWTKSRCCFAKCWQCGKATEHKGVSNLHTHHRQRSRSHCGHVGNTWMIQNQNSENFNKPQGWRATATTTMAPCNTNQSSNNNDGLTSTDHSMPQRTYNRQHATTTKTTPAAAITTITTNKKRRQESRGDTEIIQNEVSFSFTPATKRHNIGTPKHSPRPRLTPQTTMLIVNSKHNP